MSALKDLKWQCHEKKVKKRSQFVFKLVLFYFLLSRSKTSFIVSTIIYRPLCLALRQTSYVTHLNDVCCIMRFVGYDVCRLMVVVGKWYVSYYDVCRLWCLSLMMFVAYRVCRSMVKSTSCPFWVLAPEPYQTDIFWLRKKEWTYTKRTRQLFLVATQMFLPHVCSYQADQKCICKKSWIRAEGCLTLTSSDRR